MADVGIYRQWPDGLGARGKFAEAVSARLATQGIDIPPGMIQGGLAVDNARSLLTISLTGSETIAVHQAPGGVIAVLTEDNAGVAAIGRRDGRADPTGRAGGQTKSAPAFGTSSICRCGWRWRCSPGWGWPCWPIIWDPAVRDREELEDVGLAILGEIPPEKRR